MDSVDLGAGLPCLARRYPGGCAGAPQVLHRDSAGTGKRHALSAYEQPDPDLWDLARDPLGPPRDEHQQCYENPLETEAHAPPSSEPYRAILYHDAVSGVNDGGLWAKSIPR